MKNKLHNFEINFVELSLNQIFEKMEAFQTFPQILIYVSARSCWGNLKTNDVKLTLLIKGIN